MSTIVTRAGKGSPLTHNEVDANFTNLNGDKYEAGDSPSFGSITVTGTVDGRDIAADGTKLDGIEAGADVTDTANVTAAGALMDSEVTNLAAVKAFDPTDYATAAQGDLADTSLQKSNNLSDVDSASTSLNNLGLTATAAELNMLDGADATLTPSILANPTNYLDQENRIINGAFDFWQRGTSSTAGGYVAADRWAQNVIGGTVTQSRQSHTLGDKFGSNSPKFYLRQTVSGQSAATHAGQTQQLIEDVRSYAGETITVLGWARRSSGSGSVVVEAAQNFGTGGSPSAVVNAISPTTITLTADWEPFAAVLAIPSITGKALGTDGNDRLDINFWASAGSNFNARTNSLGIQTIGVDLWGIHIKRGTHTADATDFYRAPELGPELARCQRYYEVGRTENNGSASASGHGIALSEKFAVVKRANPSVTLSNLNSLGVVSSANFTAQTIRAHSFVFNAGSTNSPGGYISSADYAADAEL